MFDDVDGLTAEHRARIVAALPPGVEMTPEAWADLHEIVVGYRIFETRRASYPIAEERKHRERLEKAVDTAAAELAVRRCGPTRIRRGANRRWRRCRRFAARSRPSPPFTKYGPPSPADRTHIASSCIQGIMRVWTDRLGGELRYSTRESTRYGPLIRFSGCRRADLRFRSAARLRDRRKYRS